jgi:glutathione S-transferase
MRQKPKLFGADYSVYVRAARLTLYEKGVDYDLVPVDVFAVAGPPSSYLARQPFGRIPALEHDGSNLYETGAKPATLMRHSTVQACNRHFQSSVPG